MGFTKEILKPGNGQKPTKGQNVTVHCTVRVSDPCERSDGVVGDEPNRTGPLRLFLSLFLSYSQLIPTVAFSHPYFSLS